MLQIKYPSEIGFYLAFYISIELVLGGGGLITFGCSLFAWFSVSTVEARTERKDYNQHPFPFPVIKQRVFQQKSMDLKNAK